MQLGQAPKRLDLLTSIDGVTFEECWPDHVVVEIDGLSVPFIDVEHLIANKRASGRLQDLADVEALGKRETGAADEASASAGASRAGLPGDACQQGDSACGRCQRCHPAGVRGPG